MFCSTFYCDKFSGNLIRAHLAKYFLGVLRSKQSSSEI